MKSEMWKWRWIEKNEKTKDRVESYQKEPNVMETARKLDQVWEEDNDNGMKWWEEEDFNGRENG